MIQTRKPYPVAWMKMGDTSKLVDAQNISTISVEDRANYIPLFDTYLSNEDYHDGYDNGLEAGGEASYERGYQEGYTEGYRHGSAE